MPLSTVINAWQLQGHILQKGNCLLADALQSALCRCGLSTHLCCRVCSVAVCAMSTKGLAFPYTLTFNFFTSFLDQLFG